MSETGYCSMDVALMRMLFFAMGVIAFLYIIEEYVGVIGSVFICLIGASITMFLGKDLTDENEHKKNMKKRKYYYVHVLLLIMLFLGVCSIVFLNIIEEYEGQCISVCICFMASPIIIYLGVYLGIIDVPKDEEKKI